MSRSAQGACGAVVANLYLVAAGPAVVYLVPCEFDVVPMGGTGAFAVGCNGGHDDGRHDGYSGGHLGERLLDVLYCLDECSVGGDEALIWWHFFEWMCWQGCLAMSPVVVPVQFPWPPGWCQMGSLWR